MSKGSAPRPFDVDRQTYSNNWDAIFKTKDVQNEPNDTQKRDEKPKDSATCVPKEA